MASPFPGMDPYLEAYWGDVHTSLIVYARDQLNSRRRPTMASPFPGMDPYLERHWADVHKSLPVYASGELHHQLRPKVVARVDEFALECDTHPSCEAPTLRSLHILDLERRRMVTALEFLVPPLKTAAGRDFYRRKQRSLLDRRINVVEIDLTRSRDDLAAPYRTSVFRRHHTEVYRISLRERIPVIHVPLRETDADAVLDLQPLLDHCYERGSYAFTIDYRRDPDPPLQGEDAAWADKLLRAKGKR